jgi:hypothetical protein
MDAALKKEVLEKLMASDDDDLFSILQEDIAIYEISKAKDVTDGLSEEDFAELKELNEEPAEKDTISLEELKTKYARWLSK